MAYKKRQRAKKRKEMELLMRDNLLNILTVPGNEQSNKLRLNEFENEKHFDVELHNVPRRSDKFGLEALILNE